RRGGGRATPQPGGRRAPRAAASAATRDEERRVCREEETAGGGGRDDQRTGAGARVAARAVSGLEESRLAELADGRRVQRETLAATGRVGDGSGVGVSGWRLNVGRKANWPARTNSGSVRVAD